jgi:uncharacterized protein YecT (DUF1311 family)
MRAYVFFPSLVLLSSLTFAAPDGGGLACNRAGNQQEMNECAVNAFRASDAQLSIQYQQVMAGQAPVERVTLRQEQHSWLKQRDPQCKAKTKESEGGSIWPLAYYSCLEAANKTRMLELASWAAKK